MDAIELFGTFDQEAATAMIPEAWSGDGLLRTKDQCDEWAAKLGCDVVVASDRQLFIDIDTDYQFELFNKQLSLLKKHFYFGKVDIKPSKQGLPHRHITVNLYAPYSLIERIALQACMGSDPTRELISVRRAMDQEENVVIFFEKRAE